MSLPIPTDQLRWLLKEKYGWSEVRVAQLITAADLLVLSTAEQADVERLLKGEPLAYVIGWVEFLGHHVDLSQKTLIPRSETEYWVEKVIGNHELRNHFQRILMSRKTPQILDLCCGSGCIGIAFAKSFPMIHVTFVDISEAALKQTKINLDLNHVAAEQNTITSSNLFSALADQSFDLIVTNPPYVDPDGEVSGDLAWEPSEALFAQNNGLSLIEQIILKSKKHLNSGGSVIIEFGKGQEQAIAEFCENAGWESVTFYPDQYGVTRYVWLQAA